MDVNQDLYWEEQSICDNVNAYAQTLDDDMPCDSRILKDLAKEYCKLLRQLRRMARISDGTASTLKTTEIYLQDKVYIDMLTGINNRRFLDENLKRVIRSLARTNGSLSVLMMDIDFFKRFNDAYGHSAGDICLKSVARAIAMCLHRADDFAVRYGGEEFAVVLPSTNEAGAKLIARNILANVRGLGISHENNEADTCVTISIGIATSQNPVRYSAEDFLKKADAALYHSKHNGRNQYTHFKMED